MTSDSATKDAGLSKIQEAAQNTSTSNQETIAFFEDEARLKLWVGDVKFKFCKVEPFQNGWSHMMNNGQVIQRDGRTFFEAKVIYEEGLQPELPVTPLIEGQPLVDPTLSIPGVKRYWVLSRNSLKIEDTYFVVLHVLWTPWPVFDFD